MRSASLAALKAQIEDLLNVEESDKLHSIIDTIISDNIPSDKAWCILSQNHLNPNWPLCLHQAVFDFIYSEWNEEILGPAPIWVPTDAYIENSSLQGLINNHGFSDYDEYYQWTISNEPLYIEKSIKKVKFDRLHNDIFTQTKDVSKPKWLNGATLNIYNTIFDLAHINDTALIIGKNDTDIEKISFGQLKELTDIVAASISSSKLAPGDSIAICANYTLEAIAVFLGAIKCGCLVSCILNNISSSEIQKRLDTAPPKLVFVEQIIQHGETQSTYDKFQYIDSYKTVVINGVGDKSKNNVVSWSDFLDTDIPCTKDAFSYEVDAPLFICFSSGTTAEPKGVVITHEMVLANAGYSIPKEQVSYWPTNLGWILGTITLFSSTVNHSPLALFYPGPKHPSFSKFIRKSGIKRFGTYPRVQRYWRENNSLDPEDLHDIQFLFSSGEPCDYDDQFDLIRRTGYKPLLESCGATELGKSYLYSIPIRPISIGYFNAKVPGRDIIIVNRQTSTQEGAGEVFIKSHHFGLARNVLNYNHDSLYFKGNPINNKHDDKEFRIIGDIIQELPWQQCKILGRVGDTLNIGGALYHPISIEQHVNKLPFVQDSATIGIFEKNERMKLIVFVVLNNKDNIPASLTKYIQDYLRDELDSNILVRDVRSAGTLPYTSTGKLKRGLLRAQYQEEKCQSLTI